MSPPPGMHPLSERDLEPQQRKPPSRRPLRLGWFSTGRGEGSLGLLATALDAIDAGRLDARIEFVFCNRERGQESGSDRFMDFVESRGIPLAAFSSRRFRRERNNKPWEFLREAFDQAAAGILVDYRPDAVVSAGYMLIAPFLCKVYRMINVHPALPDGPTGMWQQVIWELIGQRADQSGAMVHLVTEEVDGGPVLSYCSYPIRGPEFDPHRVGIEEQSLGGLKYGPGEDLPLFRKIREAGLVRERALLVETLRSMAEGKVDLGVAASGRHTPLNLTTAVEAALKDVG